MDEKHVKFDQGLDFFYFFSRKSRRKPRKASGNTSKNKKKENRRHPGFDFIFKNFLCNLLSVDNGEQGCEDMLKSLLMPEPDLTEASLEMLDDGGFDDTAVTTTMSIWGFSRPCRPLVKGIDKAI